MPNGGGFAFDSLGRKDFKRNRGEEDEHSDLKIEAWLNEAGLTIAAHKMKAVSISQRKIMEKMNVTVGGTEIEKLKHGIMRQV